MRVSRGLQSKRAERTESSASEADADRGAVTAAATAATATAVTPCFLPDPRLRTRGTRLMTLPFGTSLMTRPLGLPASTPGRLFLMTLGVTARGGLLLLVLIARHRGRLFLGHAFVTLGDLTDRAGERADPRRLALELGEQRLADLGRFTGPALLDEIALERRLGALAHRTVDNAAEATEPRQFLLGRAHPLGAHHVLIGGRPFDGRNDDGTQAPAGQFTFQLLEFVRRLLPHRLQRREAVFFAPACLLLRLLGFRGLALTLFLFALAGGFALGLGARFLRGFGLFARAPEGCFALGLLGLQTLRLGLGGLSGARSLGKLPLAFLFLALARGFALGFRARFLGGLGLFARALKRGFLLRLALGLFLALSLEAGLLLALGGQAITFARGSLDRFQMGLREVGERGGRIAADEFAELLRVAGILDPVPLPLFLAGGARHLGRLGRLNRRHLLRRRRRRAADDGPAAGIGHCQLRDLLAGEVGVKALRMLREEDFPRALGADLLDQLVIAFFAPGHRRHGDRILLRRGNQ